MGNKKCHAHPFAVGILVTLVAVIGCCLLVLTHIILLIHALATHAWDNAASSINIVTIFAIVVCVASLLVPDDESRSNLYHKRRSLLLILAQTLLMTGLLVGTWLTRPLTYLLVMHCIELAVIVGLLGSHSLSYHKIRLAPPQDNLHTPFNAMIRGDLNAMQAAVPDYRRATLDAQKRQKRKNQATSPRAVTDPASHETNKLSEPTALAERKESSDSAATPPHPKGTTPGSAWRDAGRYVDDRKWWEKF